jgi:hypothetical protein
MMKYRHEVKNILMQLFLGHQQFPYAGKNAAICAFTKVVFVVKGGLEVFFLTIATAVLCCSNLMVPNEMNFHMA